MRISDWSADVCSSYLREALERGEGRGLGRRAGGDVDDAAHRIARITRRIGAIDDVELRDVAGADDPPGGGIAERVAEEIRHHEAVDHDEAARRLGRVRAAKSRHRVVIPDETRAEEEIGRVFDQIIGVERIEPGELIVAETEERKSEV